MYIRASYAFLYMYISAYSSIYVCVYTAYPFDAGK